MIVKESILRDFARLIIWYPVRLIIGLLPVQFAFSLFRCLGKIHFFVSKNLSNKLKSNIQRAFPSANARRLDSIARVYLENHYIDRLHIFTYPSLLQSGNLSKICRIEGIGLLNQALTRKKGAIVILGHYGPIQLPLFQLGLSGYSLIQVGLPTDEGLSRIGRNVAFRLRLVYEKMIPARILPAGDFLRPLFKHLKENGVVMMNIDPAGGGHWLGRLLWKPFFGQTIPFPMGAALLAQKTGASVLPLSIHRDDRKRYLFRIHPERCIDDYDTVEDFVGNLAEWYEAIVAEDPGLWHFWDEFEQGKLIRN